MSIVRRLRFFAVIFTIVVGEEVCCAQEGGLFGPMPSNQVLSMKLARELDLKGVSVPLGLPNEEVRIGFARLRVVSKQVGKMRIGVFPELEVTGMSWEVQGAVSASDWCALVRSFFEREPLIRQSRYQGFSLVFDSMKNFRMKAKEARFEEHESVLQIEKPVLEIGGDCFHFSRGELSLKGWQAGKLVIVDEVGHRLGLQIPTGIPPARFIRKQQKHHDIKNE